MPRGPSLLISWLSLRMGESGSTLMGVSFSEGVSPSMSWEGRHSRAREGGVALPHGGMWAEEPWGEVPLFEGAEASSPASCGEKRRVGRYWGSLSQASFGEGSQLSKGTTDKLTGSSDGSSKGGGVW